MRQSPPLAIPRGEIESPSATTPGKPLPYIAAHFLASMLAYPQAVILLAGPSTLASVARDKLSHSLAVPSNRIQIVPLQFLPYRDQVSAIVDYWPDHTINIARSGAAEFQIDFMKFNVDFDVSPDGAFVEEVMVQWKPLKTYIKLAAVSGLNTRIKVATTIVSVFAFDRPASDRVEFNLKEKIKAGLGVDVGAARRVNVEFFGAAGIKLQDGSSKPFFEAGAVFSVPLDIF